MNIYLICPVRDSSDRELVHATNYVKGMEKFGHKVHFPHRDAPQDDATGAQICAVHREAMQAADSVHVIWNVDSKGSHFDLGMAYALGKPIVPVWCVQPDPPAKSYWKAVINPPNHMALFDYGQVREAFGPESSSLSGEK